jgi:hypothetical protein
MAALGVHFALTEEEVARLLACESDQARLDLIREEYEGRYFGDHPEYLAESDKAWDGMHRVLSDGKYSFDGGTYPLNHAVLAGVQLSGDPDEIMSLKSAEQVRAIAAALSSIDEVEFRRRYDALDAEDYGSSSEEDASYTWECFAQVRAFYERAAAAGRPVLFTVSL